MGQCFKKYIGRDYEKNNCLDLVKELYKDFFDLEIKDYTGGRQDIDRREVESLIHTNRGDFVRVKDEDKKEFGDIVVIKLYGIECHIAMYIGHDCILHTGRVVGSHIAKLDKYRHLIAGFYRHREKTA